MNRIELENHISQTFSTVGEQLFARYPNFQIFRHLGSKKWFAVVMDIPKKNLGLSDDGMISVVNLKCNTLLIGSFREEPGIFPAWHMRDVSHCAGSPGLTATFLWVCNTDHISQPDVL